ncbi:hypothetical protein [Mesorhizobium sp. PAMC28654]
MLRILSSLATFFAGNGWQRQPHDSETTRWVIDPLSHPVLGRHVGA